MAGRVADAVVTGGTWPGRTPAVVVVDAAGEGVNNADPDADARPGVARAVRITASEGGTASVAVAAAVGITASVAVATATAVTNAPAATRAGAAAEARDATSSLGPDAASGNAAAGPVATELRGVQGGIRGGQPAVVVSANGVGTPAEAAGERGGVRADGRRNGGAAIGRRAARPDAGRHLRRASVDGGGNRDAAERGGHAGERPQPSEGQEVDPPYAAYHKWYRVGSIAPEGDALRAHLSASAVNRLAAAGGAPAGAVGLAIGRVPHSGVHRLHASLRTSSDRTVGEAMVGVVKVVKELCRATHMEDDIGRILNEVRAADRVASADERFVYDDSDASGGSRPAGPRRRHR